MCAGFPHFLRLVQKTARPFGARCFNKVCVLTVTAPTAADGLPNLGIESTNFGREFILD